MAFNPLNTYEYLAAVSQIPPLHTFLRDRYFPTGEEDIFTTQKVLVEYQKGSKKIAPVVAPRKGGVAVMREGYKMREYEPPIVAPKRTTSIDDLAERGFGEAFLPTLTSEERESQLALKDSTELDALISRREEQMAAACMIGNGYELKQIADDIDEGDLFEIKFYDGDDNPADYVVSTPWSNVDAPIMGDLEAMVFMLTEKGYPVSDLIVSSDVVSAIKRNKEIRDILMVPDGKFNIGNIDPKVLPAGASLVANLNVNGYSIDVLSYNDSYADDADNVVKFIPSGQVILTAPGCGKTLYGAVTQLEQADNKFHTYAGRRVPKIIADPVGNSKEVTLTAKPLVMPINDSPWATANVL